MSVITDIAPARGRPGRFDIVVDGRALATLSADAIDRLQLSVGREVSALADRITREAEQVSVIDRALNMLAFRARSSVELSRALLRKGDAPELVEVAISRLQQQGILDDAAYAQAYTRAKVLGAKQSRRRVQQGLAKKGVPRGVSDAAIDTVFDEEGVDQGELVELAARKKLGTMLSLEPLVRKRRLYAFLARRGYEVDDIRRAMQTVEAEVRGTA